MDNACRESILVFSKKNCCASLFTLEVKRNGKTIISKQIERNILSENIVRQEVREDGLVGTLFRPYSGSEVPAILVLGESDGGLDETTASLLAYHGYATLALSYFKHEKLPITLTEIPLEYFQKALSFLRNQDEINEKKIGVFGRSKGGELSLLLGSIFPEISFVISHTGGGVVFQGIGLKQNRITSSWSMGGIPLPFTKLSFLRNPLFLLSLFKKKVRRQPPSFLSLYEKALEKLRDNHPSIIPVENIKGPVLLISGTNDLVWPSTMMAERVIQQFKKKISLSS
ncbi:acyl-CoA thioester hydrolase/BAAT C-terminal domain-containing protein [Bacillus sp. RC51]|uniref:acyl-CoA thioester hydrolase/BAAT C-terminal domain-containing protein n=1 Tax=Bacillus TaxID=1386 RepID=UPI0038347734